jgi:hypothetical protein
VTGQEKKSRKGSGEIKREKMKRFVTKKKTQ